MNLQSSRIKYCCDQKARLINFDMARMSDSLILGERGKTPKLQNNLEGLFRIVKKLSKIFF